MPSNMVVAVRVILVEYAPTLTHFTAKNIQFGLLYRLWEPCFSRTKCERSLDNTQFLADFPLFESTVSFAHNCFAFAYRASARRSAFFHLSFSSPLLLPF